MKIDKIPWVETVNTTLDNKLSWFCHNLYIVYLWFYLFISFCISIHSRRNSNEIDSFVTPFLFNKLMIKFSHLFEFSLIFPIRKPVYAVMETSARQRYSLKVKVYLPLVVLSNHNNP